MKSEPAPEVSGNTPWERLDSAVRTAFSVPRDALLKEEAKIKRRREKAKAKKSEHGHDDTVRAKRKNGAHSLS